MKKKKKKKKKKKNPITRMAKKKKKKMKYLVVSFTLRFFTIFQASNKTIRLHLFFKIKHCRPQSNE